jgi:uncharacterized protein YpmB
MKPLNALIVVVAVFAFCALQIQRAKADDFDFNFETPKSDTTSIWKSDGSLVIIKGAEEAGYVIKGDDSGSEIEYFVVPKDDGSPTFIYDDGLTICSNTGCY